MDVDDHLEPIHMLPLFLACRETDLKADGFLPNANSYALILILAEWQLSLWAFCGHRLPKQEVLALSLT